MQVLRTLAGLAILAGLVYLLYQYTWYTVGAAFIIGTVITIIDSRREKKNHV